MKNLFNNISQEEKNRILEMHSSKKNTLSEQSIDSAVNWVKDKVKNMTSNTVSSFKAEATVEDDMMMEFTVVNFHYGGFGVTMFIKDPVSGKELNVKNFKGPIFEGTKQVYRDSYFSNINSKNWKTIAKQNNIPVSEVMV